MRAAPGSRIGGSTEGLRAFRDRLRLEIPDEALSEGLPPYYEFPPDSPEEQYLLACRRRLGGDLPKRVVDTVPIALPGDEIYVKSGVVYINGKAVPRERAGDYVGPEEDGHPIPRYRETLPNGVSYYVLDAEKFARMMNNWFPMAVHLLEGAFLGVANTQRVVGQHGVGA